MKTFSSYQVVQENIFTGRQRVLASFIGKGCAITKREDSARYNAERFLDKKVRTKQGDYISETCFTSGRNLYFVCKIVQSNINN